MSHKLKFCAGEQVRVIGNRFKSPSGAEIGGVYTIAESVIESRKGKSAGAYQEYRLREAVPGWVCEDDIESV